MNNLRKEEEITNKLNELYKQKKYLEEFLTLLHKGSATKNKVETELIPLSREIKSLEWCLNSDLPF
jgi:hypothetical protein